MLVLSRRKGESIMLGDNIEIQILHASGGQVRIGIRAPKDLAVLRGELFASVRQGNHEAAQMALDAADVTELGKRLKKKDDDKA